MQRRTQYQGTPWSSLTQPSRPEVHYPSMVKWDMDRRILETVYAKELADKVALTHEHPASRYYTGLYNQLTTEEVTILKIL